MAAEPAIHLCLQTNMPKPSRSRRCPRPLTRAPGRLRGPERWPLLKPWALVGSALVVRAVVSSRVVVLAAPFVFLGCQGDEVSPPTPSATPVVGTTPTAGDAPVASASPTPSATPVAGTTPTAGDTPVASPSPVAEMTPERYKQMRQAAHDGNVRSLRYAVRDGARVDEVDENGRTALMLAAFNGHAEVVRFLLEQGAQLDVVDGAGRTALMYAASGPNASTVKLLLEKGAGVNLKDSDEGFTPLMFAAAEGQTEVVALLLEHDADISIRDVDGDDAATFARQKGHQVVVELIGKKASERP